MGLIIICIYICVYISLFVVLRGNLLYLPYCSNKIKIKINLPNTQLLGESINTRTYGVHMRLVRFVRDQRKRLEIRDLLRIAYRGGFRHRRRKHEITATPSILSTKAAFCGDEYKYKHQKLKCIKHILFSRTTIL